MAHPGSASRVRRLTRFTRITLK